MDVKHSVAIAKQHIADLFAEEGARNVGLEEVEFDDEQGVWIVTVGFSRPWDEPKNTFAVLAGDNQTKRSYKVVRLLDDDGQVISVKSYQGGT